MVIIKADDVRGPTEKWDRFFALSTNKGVKVSAGIICESLQDEKPAYCAWLKKYQSSGLVEFWNHGWDHKKWEADKGKEVKEFAGSGYAHQKKHYQQSQAIMKKVLGVAPIAFGTPYNASDADTSKVMKEDPNLRLYFCNVGKAHESILSAQMILRGEPDGAGKPDFKKFKADYVSKKKVSFTVLQFHPNNFSDEHFSEYSKILDFMLAEGWTFVLPFEYVAHQEKKK
jgi:peptidoglycan/xylan/chitin deacetylase (PgdA/CDA1 family)